MTKQELSDKINELNIWFIKYDRQVAQYERCKRLGIAYDKDIEELDAQAQVKAQELKAAREELGE